MRIAAYQFAVTGDMVENFEKIKNADERLFMTWIVDVLEKGKSDFVKEKLSILGEKYDAASAILYFKSQK